MTVAERIRRNLPDFAHLTDREVLDARFALHHAQQLLAAELGYGSWADLAAVPSPPRPRPDMVPSAWQAFPQVFVRDVASSVVWYEQVLGFATDYLYGRPPFHAQVSRGGVAINLRGTAASPWVSPPVDDDLLAVRLEVADVKALFLEVRDRGADLHPSLRTEPWGQVTFIVRDPERNLLSFGSPMHPSGPQTSEDVP